MREEILQEGLNCYLNELPCFVSSCYQTLHFGFLQLIWSCWIFGQPVLAGPSMKIPLNFTNSFSRRYELRLIRDTHLISSHVAWWMLVECKPCQLLKQLFDKNITGLRLCTLHVYKSIDNNLHYWPIWIISNGLQNKHKHTVTKFINYRIYSAYN